MMWTTVMWFLFWSYGVVVADALTVVSFENNATVEGRLANFGRYIALETIFSTDLFLPPLRMNGTGTLSTTDRYDEYLCFPPSDNRRHLESVSPESSSGVVEDQTKRRMEVEVIQEDGDESSNVLGWTPPDTRGVALLVKRGVCSFEEKARMAIRLNTEYAASSSTSPLKRRIDFILVYHNETGQEDALLQMGGPVDDASIDVGLIYISNSVGTYMQRRMLRKLVYTDVDSAMGPYINANALRQEPPKTLYETERNYEGWQYLVRFFTSGESDDNDDGGGGWNRPGRDPSRSGGSNTSNDFYWIRFVLFGLLIAAPCLRGVSVWYSAGGRIRCVRNERGCMVGLEIIRPANPHWLTQNNNDGGRRSSRRIRLTVQQVLALPEIEYNPLPSQPPPSTEIFNDEPIGVDKMDANVVVHDDMNADCVESDTLGQGTFLNEGSNNTIPVHEEEGGEPDSLVTTCTACSICIDDFETGEKIRLLPRCRHAFHTDCIMPWLTERQGCCPLCKTLVREEDESTDETPEQSHSSTPAGNTDDRDSIHEEEDGDIEMQA
eukprot:CAMPEP_0198291458 /NCGR_PEP_ID=MMETSP1449-20131203/8976_1 /TAXON_ID=420275 /ORGANISM="Attheya septentrionalis, Strain CCMP2084" /LENGTH=549 /DNA_ID=CAMNT_0043990099 /DNA_START=178 /DNA_END=1827 /DNA_ORIENTATION=+